MTARGGSGIPALSVAAVAAVAAEAAICSTVSSSSRSSSASVLVQAVAVKVCAQWRGMASAAQEGCDWLLVEPQICCT